jgi:hypothetical protein
VGPVSTSIQEVKAKHASRLMEQPGVISVGVGRDAEGKPAIIIGLDGPRPRTVAALPKSLEGFPVIPQVIGGVKPH